MNGSPLPALIVSSVLVVFLVFLSGGMSSKAQSSIVSNPRAIGATKFALKSESFDAKSGALDLVCEAAGGIFSFDVGLKNAGVEQKAIKSVKLTVQGQSKCAALYLQRGDSQIELLKHEGVAVSKTAQSVEAVFSGKGLEELAAGGRLHFINEYR